jgi:hypothetical protein
MYRLSCENWCGFQKRGIINDKILKSKSVGLLMIYFSDALDGAEASLNWNRDQKLLSLIPEMQLNRTRICVIFLDSAIP